MSFKKYLLQTLATFFFLTTTISTGVYRDSGYLLHHLNVHSPAGNTPSVELSSKSHHVGASCLRLRGGSTNFWGSPQPQGNNLFGVNSPTANTQCETTAQGQSLFTTSPLQQTSPTLNPFGFNQQQQQQQQQQTPVRGFFSEAQQQGSPFKFGEQQSSSFNPFASSLSQSQPQQGSNPFSMFGGSNQNSGGSSSIFGGSMPQGSTAPSGFGTGGLSGQSSAPGAPSIFGGSSTGLFGGQQSQQNPPQQSQGLFGSLNQNQPDKPSFFSNMPGSSSSVFGNLGGSSIFSSEPNNTQPSQSSLFGGPIGTAGSMFGGPPSTAPQTSSLFGNPSQTPPLQPSLLFDPSRNSFNPGSSNPQGNLFSPGAQAPPVSGLNQGSMGFLGQQGQQMGQLPTSQVNAELLRAKESIAHLERALGSINAPSAQTGAAREVVLPPGWAKQWDLNRQAFFYINCNNNPPTVQWEPPPAPLNPLPGDGNTNPTALSPLYSFLNRLWGSTPSVGSEVRPASHFPAAVVPAIDGVRSTWNSPGDIAVIRLLVSAFAGAAGSVFSIGQLLIFVFECLARIMAKRGAPLIASAVKGLLEGPAGGNQLSSYVRNMRFGSGPRGGTRPGAEQVRELPRVVTLNESAHVSSCWSLGGSCSYAAGEETQTMQQRRIPSSTTGRAGQRSLLSDETCEQDVGQLGGRLEADARGLVQVLNGELYVVGGWDGRSVLSSVERLDVSLGRWVRVADLRIPRASPALAVLDGFLYVMGGFDGQDWLRQ
eukprot:754272-Hanusia_phi.AAC.1